MKMRVGNLYVGPTWLMLLFPLIPIYYLFVRPFIKSLGSPAHSG